jgi:hypothetical protein
MKMDFEAANPSTVAGQQIMEEPMLNDSKSYGVPTPVEK